MEEAFLVSDVPQVPKLHRVVNRGRRQQPVASRVKLCMGHFSFVQLVAKNLNQWAEQGQLYKKYSYLSAKTCIKQIV